MLGFANRQAVPFRTYKTLLHRKSRPERRLRPTYSKRLRRSRHHQNCGTPPAVVTLVLPVTAPVGSVAVTCVLLFTVKVVGRRTTRHSCRPREARPGDYDLCSHRAAIGAKLVICGMTRNFLLLVSASPKVVTATEPVVAPLGRLAGPKRQQAAALPRACPPADIRATLTPRLPHLVSCARSAAPMATLGRARC